ncbi:putative mitochondrial carrier protein LEU5 [Podospora fimiseda]|uniref:Mitochondrial thiamine pyrophosphate carrier 1 n=1 Tax=Podospora fimiseda TaxID=252190 RepID=A0AAN7BQH9_9PEZI|nr:putative mitochondrial carrier protein LEU5 [Podospora fimiseda]
MPTALMSHASLQGAPSTKIHRDPIDATKTRYEVVKKSRDPPVCPTDDEQVPQSPAKNKRSVDYVWRSGVAGGLAGCAAKTIVAPLDRVKILFQSHNPHFVKYTGSWRGVSQAMKVIYGQDGALGLFRGHSATLLRIFPYAGIKFIAYEQIRAVVIPSKDKETPFRRLISGSLAGVTSVFFTYPLEVIRVRLAFETKKGSHSSFTSICKQIYDEHPKPPVPASGVVAETVNATATKFGITNFYRGFSPTLLGMLPYAGMSFLTHDTAGDILRHPKLAKWTTIPQPENAPDGKKIQLRSWAELLAGGVAGLVSQTVSYPLEVIRRRMQVGGAVGDGHRLRIAETAALIMRGEHGLRGFFVGLTIGYAKVVPMVAASFYTYERLKTAFGI